VFTLDNYASPDKASAGDNALDDAAGRCKLIAITSILQGSHNQGGGT